jgi:hypothetical protein
MLKQVVARRFVGQAIDQRRDGQALGDLALTVFEQRFGVVVLRAAGRLVGLMTIAVVGDPVGADGDLRAVGTLLAAVDGAPLARLRARRTNQDDRAHHDAEAKTQSERK